MVYVRKKFVIQGDNEIQLAVRLKSFMQALSTRGGAVSDLKTEQQENGRYTAMLRYRLSVNEYNQRCECTDESRHGVVPAA